MRERTRKGFPWRRTLSLMLVVVMVMGLLVTPALAAKSASKSGKQVTFQVESGRGLFYAWKWWDTKLTITNTGKKPITIYEKTRAGLMIKNYSVRPGQSKTYKISGSGTRTAFLVQGDQGSKASVRATVSAGSIW